MEIGFQTSLSYGIVIEVLRSEIQNPVILYIKVPSTYIYISLGPRSFNLISKCEPSLALDGRQELSHELHAAQLDRYVERRGIEPAQEGEYLLYLLVCSINSTFFICDISMSFNFFHFFLDSLRLYLLPLVIWVCLKRGYLQIDDDHISHQTGNVCGPS